MLSYLLTILALTGLRFPPVSNKYRQACKTVEAAMSNASKVYYPGDPLYTEGGHHFFASNQESPACVVEPGTPEDVGNILNVVDATKTPFAVMSGGHATNPGFSSTKGIHIYTRKFSQVTYDTASGTVVIGTGLTWDAVYQRLNDHRVSVVGGRVEGVGVGGFLLGGGYSYKSNQYGLGVDTIVGFNLVLPNGTVTYVTQSTHPDLFFGLKGSFNNFGIVTDFTMTALPQTEVWGGSIMYPSLYFKEVRSAIANFSVHAQDPKAAVLPWYISHAGRRIIHQGIFYDGPTPPHGIFDNFTNIPSLSSDLKTRSFADAILNATTAGIRGSFQMLGVSHFSETLLEAVEDELMYWTAKLAPKGEGFISYVAEPFLQSYLSHANSPSAFPTLAARQPGRAPNPLLVWFGWENPLYDNQFVAAAEESANRLAAVARAEGLFVGDPPALYGNYVNTKTPLVDIYGDNLPKLRALKAKIDPNNVMGLSGGFKF